MLAFGHVALPLAAVIAVGLLFMGIQLFFLSPGREDGAVEIAGGDASDSPASVQVAQVPTLAPTPPPTPRPTPAPTPEAAETDVALAAPIGQGGDGYVPATPPPARTQSGQGGTTSRPRTQQGAGGTATKPAAPPAPGSAKFGVQIGAFTDMERAQSVVKDVAKLGYSAKVISAQSSSGKTFHRVRVLAGSTREGAEKMSKELEKKGFPVLVVQNP